MQPIIYNHVCPGSCILLHILHICQNFRLNLHIWMFLVIYSLTFKQHEVHAIIFPNHIPQNLMNKHIWKFSRYLITYYICISKQLDEFISNWNFEIQFPESVENSWKNWMRWCQLHLVNFLMSFEVKCDIVVFSNI